MRPAGVSNSLTGSGSRRINPRARAPWLTPAPGPWNATTLTPLRARPRGAAGPGVVVDRERRLRKVFLEQQEGRFRLSFPTDIGPPVSFLGRSNENGLVGITALHLE
jgi:hypothetical protein